MALLIEIACNDPHSGQFQGYADFFEIEGVRMRGGRVKVDYCNNSLSGYDARVDGPYTLRVGRIKVPHWHHHSWYGNWCWEAFSVTWPHALKVLNYLAKQPDWHCEEGPCEIYTVINERGVVTPQEWKDRDRAPGALAGTGRSRTMPTERFMRHYYGASGYVPPIQKEKSVNEPIMQFFAYAHLPEHLQEVSKPFGLLAEQIMQLPRNPERTVALRKLLEAKDAAVRAKLFKE